MTITQANTSGTFGGPNVGRVASVQGGLDLRTGSYSMAWRVKWGTSITTADMYGPTMGVAANARGFYWERRSGDAATVLVAYRFNGTATFNTATVTGAYGSTTAWVHLCATYDGTTIRTYVDGVANGTVASASTLLASPSAMDAISLCGPINGDVADVCFFSRALSAAEVLQLSAIRQPGSLARGDCLGWFPTIETSSLTNAGLDYSGRGNHCTLQASGANNPAVSNTSVPKAWGGSSLQQALRITPVTVAITGAGSSQTTGAAALTSGAALAASGTTNVTGAAVIASSAGLSASGSTQTTGAADLPSGLSTDLATGVATYGCAAWVYPRSNVAASDVFYQDLTGGGVYRVSVNGTTLRFEAQNPGAASSYVYSQSISLNAWTHVALDVNGSTARATVNGAQVDSAAFSTTGLTALTTCVIGKNADMTIRDAYVGGIMTAGLASRLYSARSHGIAQSTAVAPLTFFPLLEGGARLVSWGRFSRTLTVLGTVTEGSENPPAAWGGTNTLQYLTQGATAFAAAGSTQTTGAATLTSSASVAAAGSTATTGAAALTASAAIAASGLVQSSGAATLASTAALVATGSVQTTGAAAGAVTAPLIAAGLVIVTGSASPSGALLAIGTTNVTGSAVVSLAQTFQVIAAGSVTTSGAAALAIAYAIASSGSTQVTGSATLSTGAAGGGAGLQTGSERRWADIGGTRRRTRR